MKRLINSFLALIICTGLLLAGSEANNTITQVFAGIGGVMMFAGGCLGFWKINGGNNGNI